MEPLRRDPTDCVGDSVIGKVVFGGDSDCEFVREREPGLDGVTVPAFEPSRFLDGISSAIVLYRLWLPASVARPRLSIEGDIVSALCTLLGETV
jgi:hypothetical protein